MILKYSQDYCWFLFVCNVLLSIILPQVGALWCKCNPERWPCYANNNTCETDGRCFTVVRRHQKQTVTELGCYLLRDLQPLGNPFRCQHNQQANYINVVKCCKDRDFCNEDVADHPTLAPFPAGYVERDEKDMIVGDNMVISKPTIFAVVFFVTLIVLTLVGALILVKRSNIERFKKSKKKLLPENVDRKEPLLSVASTVNTELVSDISNYPESGSGSGMPIFNKMTIARQITLETIVGTGKYGEVWRGKWMGEEVAVKIFHSREERSWTREAEIYQTVMLRHDNVLGFIAADNKDIGTWTQLWLVTDYHHHGSLFDYLNAHSIDLETMLRMLFSIASGLSHLHMEIIGTRGKPGIAHRDLKSKNVLVKKDLSCCVADLGLAVKHEPGSNLVDIGDNSRVGTRRYMPPEIIDESFNPHNFSSFKMADIYSMALVYWEIVRRCEALGPPAEFQLPYYDCVLSDPTHDEMMKVVVIDRRRPEVPSDWLKNEMYKEICNLMMDCWSDVPGSRLTALLVKKSIMKLINQLLNSRENGGGGLGGSNGRDGGESSSEMGGGGSGCGGVGGCGGGGSGGCGGGGVSGGNVIVSSVRVSGGGGGGWVGDMV